MLGQFAQTTIEINNSGGNVFWNMTSFVFFVVTIVGLWKVFEKADEEGWKAVIPFYNAYTAFRIAGRNGWGFLLLFIPIVNIVVAIIVSIDMAKHFGKDGLFALLLILFPFIGYMILGFDEKVKYLGPKHQ